MTWKDARLAAPKCKTQAKMTRQSKSRVSRRYLGLLNVLHLLLSILYKSLQMTYRDSEDDASGIDRG
jgi:hypothetical protein